MRDIVRPAKRRLNDLEREAAEQFEAPIVHNRVWDSLTEDDRLRQVLDVTERTYNIEKREDLPDEMDRVAFGAAEDLNDHIDTLVDMAVARECAAVIEDASAGRLDDHHDQPAIRDAFDEACTWLAAHRDVAATEGIDVEQIDAVSDDLDGDEKQEVGADV